MSSVDELIAEAQNAPLKVNGNEPRPEGEDISERLARLRSEAESKPAKDSAPKKPSLRTRMNQKRGIQTEPVARKDEFTEPLTQMYAMIGLAVSGIDQHKDKETGEPNGESCGHIILENAPKMAESLQTLAEKNPAVAKALRTLTKGSAFGAVIAAHVPVVMAIVGNHTSFGDYVGNLMSAHHGDKRAA